MKNFISNESSHTLNKRLREIIGLSRELKFLVGFFYFSGIQELYESIRENSDLKIKILVGLQADRSLGVLVEHGRDKNGAKEPVLQRFAHFHPQQKITSRQSTRFTVCVR